SSCPQFLSLLPSVFFKYSRAHQDLHSFPTRRSSDLCRKSERAFGSPVSPSVVAHVSAWRYRSAFSIESATFCVRASRILRSKMRSEEHTSELQSRSDLVCRLLLEKKKKKK